MKLEIPIAVLVLALASLAVWLNGKGTSISHEGNVDDSTQIEPMAPDAGVQRNFLHPVKTETSSFGSTILQPAPGHDQGVEFRTSFRPPKPKLQTNNASTLIHEVGRQLHASGPLMADVRMTVKMFDQQIESKGRYYQMGQGTRKSRLDVEFVDSEKEATISQICDGFAYYRYQRIGGEESFDVAFLDKVASADKRVLLADAQTWMATGGIASMFTNLATNFDFQTATQSVRDGVPQTVLRGRWNERRLRHLLHGQINHNFIRDRIQWERLPPHIPVAVEIHLSQTSGGLIFPVAVNFFGRDKEEDDKPDSITLEFSSLKQLESLPEETFRVRTPVGIEMNDLTIEFVERVEDLNQAVRTAALTGDTFFQR